MKKLIFFAVLLLGDLVSAQVDPPRISPASTLVQQIGLTEVRVSYSRPAARGRKIFGALVPYGRIWRVGANESTKFKVSTDIRVEGNLLAAGEYALYAFPDEASWEIVFHADTSHWGDGRTAYNPEEDVFRIVVQPKRVEEYRENFSISFDRITHDGAIMQWLWGHTLIEIPLEVDTRAQMRKKIAKAVQEDPSAQTLYEAARYFQEQDMEHQTSRAYLLKAIELEGDTYYFYRVLSLVEAELGNYAGAIRAAEKSLKIAQEQGKDEFVRMNQENIALWKKSRQD